MVNTSAKFQIFIFQFFNTALLGLQQAEKIQTFQVRAKGRK